METLLQIFTFISLSYITSIVVGSYISIKGMEFVAKSKVKTIYKRLVSLLMGLTIGYIYYETDMAKIDTLLPSFLLSLVGYDYFIKEVLRKLETKANITNSKTPEC